MKSKDAIDIFLAGVTAALPINVLPNFFNKNKQLYDDLFSIKESGHRIIVLSLGKAGYSLAEAFNDLIAIDECFVITKFGHLPDSIQLSKYKEWKFCEGSHPLPSFENESYTRKLIEWIKQIKVGDLFVVLISGGGSALLELPIEGVTIEDLILLNTKLLADGSPIQFINEERKKYSQVKGGRLLNFLKPEIRTISLALSDVISDDPLIIASAPTYPGSEYFIVGNLEIALLAANIKAQTLGYETIIVDKKWDKDSKETGKLIALYMKEGKWKNLFGEKIPSKIAILIGGEMVAHITGTGLGGRNQEAALSFSIWSHFYNLKSFVFLSGGTDGTDGPTNAAGGIVDELSYNKMLALGLQPEEELKNSNSSPTLARINALLETGPTGTNVNDILILLVDSLGA